MTTAVTVEQLDLKLEVQSEAQVGYRLLLGKIMLNVIVKKDEMCENNETQQKWQKHDLEQYVKIM